MEQNSSLASVGCCNSIHDEPGVNDLNAVNEILGLFMMSVW